MLKRKDFKLSSDGILAIIGSILIVGGIALGLYVGIWVMLVGGLIQMTETLSATTFVPVDFTVGLLKVLFCEGASLITLVVSGIGILLREI